MEKKVKDMFDFTGESIKVKCTSFQFNSDRVLHNGDIIPKDSPYYDYLMKYKDSAILVQSIQDRLRVEL